MDQISDSLQDRLVNSDSQFRELAKEHRRFEDRLNQLASLSFPSDDELFEEKSLKKQKLFVKDQMETILQRYRHQVAT